MNAPERSDCWRLGEDEKKVEYIPDYKIPNAGNFILLKEDHTIGNLLRMQLLLDKNIRFAGYLMPHPLENSCHIKVQTNGNSNPADAMCAAAEDLAIEMDNLKDRFKIEVEKFREEQEKQFI